MGIKVSAAQAARLVHRHERVVRGWIEQGKLIATKAGAKMYEIDVNDLEHVTVRGVVVDHSLLAAMQEQRANQLQPFEERMERMMQDLERRMRLVELERRAVSTLVADGVRSRYDAPSDATRTATLARSDVTTYSAPATASSGYGKPAETVYGVEVNWFEGQVSKATCAKYAKRHGMGANTAAKYRDWPEQRPSADDVIRYLHDYMTRPGAQVPFAECDAYDCPCHELNS